MLPKTKKYKRTLFIFRRDLRLQDNTGLIQALKDSVEVMPCFIFDPRQIDDHPYRSRPAFCFMLESLEELAADLSKCGARLFFFQDKPEKILADLIREHSFDAIYCNKDYTPFGTSRDLAMKKIAQTHRIPFHACADCLLHEPDEVQKQTGGPYTVFTPFFQKAFARKVSQPQKNTYTNYFNGPSHLENKKILSTLIHSFKGATFHGGRSQALKIFKSVKEFEDYANQRDFPNLDGTTRLSAHHKFGTCSIRESFYTIQSQLGAEHPLLRQLYWRDFFTHIGYHFPYVFGQPFHDKYAKLAWENNEDSFKAWCEGKTGFPIVDAGMRELHQTGFMHNRVRMITASFLVKDLRIDWRWGEKYFATRLVDYDPCVNNGNWQWAASTGCDAQPYFRIFDPWRQQKKFDPQAHYIKKWIPELNNMSSELIHREPTNTAEVIRGYFPPLVNHNEAAEKAKEMFEILL